MFTILNIALTTNFLIKNNFKTIYVMRKNIFFAIALIFSMATFAQEESRYYENADLVKLLPQEGDGYLMWSNDNTDVKYWVIEVDEQTFTDWVFTGEKTVWRKEVWKSNYVKIPDEYWKMETPQRMYYTNLIGYGADDAEIIRTRFGADQKAANPFINKEEVDPKNVEKGCAWTCDGPNWAWMIQQWKSGPGTAYYELRSASSGTQGGNNPIAFFEYMTIAKYDTMANNYNYDKAFWSKWYNVAIDGWGFAGNPPYGTPNSPFHKIPNTGNYKDKTGTIIQITPTQTEVVRVFKRLGWWDNAYWYDDDALEFTTGEIVNPDNVCLRPRDGAGGIVNFFINHSNITEYLDPSDVPACDVNMLLCCPVGGPVSGGGNVADGNGGCLVGWSWMDYNNDGSVNGFDFIYYFTFDCGGDNGSDEPNQLYMTIENLSDTSVPFTEMTSSDFFDENGVFKQPAFTINTGLNRMRVITENGNEKYVVFEAKETLESNFALSGFLDVTFYPVPIQGDEFKMNMVSVATLDFVFEMFDFNGNLLYSTKYSVKQGHDEVHLVRSEKPIPHGLVLNRFTFSDGSVKSITTTKN
jgi:hypothetical protein